MDLYVVSGGNEWEAGHSLYQDRLYINANGKFSLEKNRLPIMNTSGSCAIPYDYDNDGDLDLFIGGRLHAQKYPYPGTSYLLENNGGVFKNVSKERMPDLVYLGMITDAIWTDFNNDGQIDLIVVGEWMDISFFKNNKGYFSRERSILPNTNGWWNCIEAADMDNDGDLDYIVGNLGLNYKYKASDENPFEVFATDFDDNGTNDIVLGYYEQDNLFPLRGRGCSSDQMPFIKNKFPTYDSFGSAKLVDVYGEEKLDRALHLSVKEFASILIETKGTEIIVTKNFR